MPQPEAGPGEVKVRILRTGICGTDLHIDSWDAWAASTIVPPLIPGHEFSGVVESLGDGVTSVAVGDLVSGEGHIVCGTCRNCRAGRRQLCVRTSSLGVNRDGAFAEFVVMPEGNLWGHSAVITDRYPVDEWEAAFATARAGNGGKVILEWSEIS